MARLTLLLLTGCSPLIVDYGDKSPGDDTGDDPIVVGDMSVSATSWDFGLVFVGQTASTELNVENVGEAPLALSLEMSGTGAASFVVSLDDDSPAPGASTTLTAIFGPADWGTFEGVATLSDASSQASVDITFAGTAQRDDDDDGVGSIESGGTDCDDNDGTAYPGAEEIWYDGVDQDCRGDNDYDQDADGTTWGTDCDDTDPDAYPGAEEVWYNGIDEDCLGGDDYDQDLDGYRLGIDCDDEDAAIFPGAVEVWYDGVDQNCDDESDYDQDTDGYDNDVDCDDMDAGIHPGADDTWYDGIDSDCAGNDDFDQDGDGSEVGTDCDDTDAAIGPPTDETWNGLDDDCDGTVDDLSISDVAAGSLYGAASSLGLGDAESIGIGGDADGDGVDDLIALSDAYSGGYGWLVSGSDAVTAAGTIETYDTAALRGSSSGLTLATVNGPMRDLVGDATDDLLVGAYSSYDGEGIVLDGDDATGTVTVTSTRDADFTGDGTSDLTQRAVTCDVDGDGVADVVIGAIHDGHTSSTGTTTYSGNVAVFVESTFSGEYDLDMATTSTNGVANYDLLGTSLACGDVTDDGHDDVIAGASANDDGANGGGAVYVFAGAATPGFGEFADDAAWVAVYGNTASMGLGGDPLPVPGDVDGDGALDLAMSEGSAGKAWVFLDVPSLSGGHPSVTDADHIVSGTASAFATSLALASDLDGDGADDLAVGASGDDTSAGNAGAVFLFLGGSWGASLTSADADVSIYGADAADALGTGLAAGGDLDNDGIEDLAIGANAVDDGATDGGAVYVLLGR